MEDSQENILATTHATRREFAKRTLAAATATIILPVVASAQTPTTTREATAPPTSATPAPTTTPPAPDPLLDAYAEVARVRFGKRLDAEEFARVRTDLAGNVRTAARLRDAKLTNADEPDFIFKV